MTESQWLTLNKGQRRLLVKLATLSGIEWEALAHPMGEAALYAEVFPPETPVTEAYLQVDEALRMVGLRGKP